MQIHCTYRRSLVHRPLKSSKRFVSKYLHETFVSRAAPPSRSSSFSPVTHASGWPHRALAELSLGWLAGGGRAGLVAACVPQAESLRSPWGRNLPRKRRCPPVFPADFWLAQGLKSERTWPFFSLITSECITLHAKRRLLIKFDSAVVYYFWPRPAISESKRQRARFILNKGGAQWNKSLASA